MKDIKEKPLLFWIPMIWNGFCFVVLLIVGIIFFIGSRMSSTAQVDPPDFVMFIFALFDFILVISPISLAVTVLISVFNVMQSGSKMRRFLPLTFSTILQGALSTILLVNITRPIS